MEPRTNEAADTLMERVNKLIQAVDRPLEWGHPLSSVTPKTLAIQDLASRTQALEDAVREIALEVQKITNASAQTPVRRSRTKLPSSGPRGHDTLNRAQRVPNVALPINGELLVPKPLREAVGRTARAARRRSGVLPRRTGRGSEGAQEPLAIATVSGSARQ